MNGDGVQTLTMTIRPLFIFFFRDGGRIGGPAIRPFVVRFLSIWYLPDDGTGNGRIYMKEVESAVVGLCKKRCSQ